MLGDASVRRCSVLAVVSAAPGQPSLRAHAVRPERRHHGFASARRSRGSAGYSRRPAARRPARRPRRRLNARLSDADAAAALARGGPGGGGRGARRDEPSRGAVPLGAVAAAAAVAVLARKSPQYAAFRRWRDHSFRRAPLPRAARGPGRCARRAAARLSQGAAGHAGGRRDPAPPRPAIWYCKIGHGARLHRPAARLRRGDRAHSAAAIADLGSVDAAARKASELYAKAARAAGLPRSRTRGSPPLRRDHPGRFDRRPWHDNVTPRPRRRDRRGQVDLRGLRVDGPGGAVETKGRPAHPAVRRADERVRHGHGGPGPSTASSACVWSRTPAPPSTRVGTRRPLI